MYKKPTHFDRNMRTLANDEDQKTVFTHYPDDPGRHLMVLKDCPFTQEGRFMFLHMSKKDLAEILFEVGEYLMELNREKP